MSIVFFLFDFSLNKINNKITLYTFFEQIISQIYLKNWNVFNKISIKLKIMFSSVHTFSNKNYEKYYKLNKYLIYLFINKYYMDVNKHFL